MKVLITYFPIFVLLHLLIAETILAIPPTPIINTDNICVGQRLKLNNANDYVSGETFVWTKDGVSFPGSTAMEPIINDIGVYVVTVFDGSGSTFDTRTISSFYKPAPITSVGDSACESTPVKITFSGHSTKDVIWLYENDTAPGSFVTSSTLTSIYNIEKSGGIYPYFLIRKDSNGCQSYAKAVKFRRYPKPTIIFNSPFNFDCTNTLLTLDISKSDTGTVFDHTWINDLSAFKSFTDSLKPTIDKPDTYTLMIRNTVTGCINFDSITKKPFIAPDAGKPKSNQVICDTTSKFNLFNLMDNITPGGTWSANEAAGNVTKINNANFNFNAKNIAAGTYHFSYTIDSTSAYCPKRFSIGTVEVLKRMLSGVSQTGLTACNASSSYDLSTALTGADAGGVWSCKSKPLLVTDANFAINNVAGGDYQFTYKFQPSSVCRTDSSKVSIKVYAMKHLGESIPQQICSTDKFNLFNALPTADRGGVWEDPLSTGKLTDSTFYSLGLKGGTYKFKYSFPDNLCPITPAIVSITTDTIPPVLKCKTYVNYPQNELESSYLDITADNNNPLVIEASDNCGKYRIYNNVNNDSTLVGARINKEMDNITWTVVDSGRNETKCIVNIKLIGIPNIITPNSDGFNDSWYFSIDFDYPQGIIIIYDRWGSKVWESAAGYPTKWDGGNVPNATYRYVIMNGKEIVLNGYVTLVR